MVEKVAAPLPHPTRPSSSSPIKHAGAAHSVESLIGAGVLLRFGFPNVAEDAPKFASLTRSPAGGLPVSRANIR
ncbi:hypothetical protein EVAR_89029_1 [Eumeta japonica]|uniref:Uncharacterized protein n=1 Tax=Eumeta variegata TaxID=151549 RepID=A0A4C1Z3U3_EUMVA|nr:hypothetical protein EVAR_89029_1 [Eumeta japonica]